MRIVQVLDYVGVLRGVYFQDYSFYRGVAFDEDA